MFCAQSAAKEHIRAKQDVLLPQVKFWFSIYDTFHCWGLETFFEKEVQCIGKAESSIYIYYLPQLFLKLFSSLHFLAFDRIHPLSLDSFTLLQTRKFSKYPTQKQNPLVKGPASPTQWNLLPSEISHIQSTPSVHKNALKTYLLNTFFN